ncbi:hypothetical protein BIW11_08618 [Tropilaelaps mercedesae]|uniref:Sodium-dependent glucose transporter 1-like n=1 Tax=Tropilaelaps mercedesae TaxID=418985 RepID=A0A1V9XNQ8_9ACAR|nr:hypothetical protein BIW11_08618 [Tropilaelaps mercedesae]
MDFPDEAFDKTPEFKLVTHLFQLGSIMLEKFHRIRVIAVSYILCGVLTGLLPWCTSLDLLIGVMLVNGISMGMVDTASTVWCLDLWCTKPDPYVHALHFSFSVGTFIAPLIAEPFLIPTEIINIVRRGFNETMYNYSTLTSATVELLMEQYEGKYYEEIAYGIIGVFMTVIGTGTLIVSLVNPSDPKRVANEHHSNYTLKSWRTLLLIAAIVLLVLLHFLIYGGVEIAYGQLIATYAVIIPKSQRLSKSAASFLTSAFWGGFMMGRGASVFISHFVENFTLIIVDHAIIVTSCFSLMFLSAKSIMVLWIATTTFGLGTLNL